MSNRNASYTALATAYLRAAHQLLDGQPKILEDPIALRILGESGLQRISGDPERYRTPEACALRARVVLRSRYAEDRLAAAVRRGVAQYVVLGAGFDTFAYRQPAWAESLRIFEVDQAGTQDLKRSHLAAAGIKPPANVSYAQIDFEHESLRDGLLRHDCLPHQPTFFSWLGVTMYLTESAIDSVLRSMAEYAVGSEVVLTFLKPDGQAAEASRTARRQLAQRVADAGEAFVSSFEPLAIRAKLIDAGFATVEFLEQEEAEARYFDGRPKDISVPRDPGLVSARR